MTHFTLHAATTVLPLAVAAAAVVVATGRRRDPRTTLWRLLVVGYLALLVTVTFFPFQVVLGDGLAPDWRTRVNLDPTASVHLDSFKLNILMTVPFGLLVPVVTRCRSVLAVTLAGAGVSVGIETLQLAQSVLLGGTRSTDVDDVITNTLGAFVGVVLFQLVLRRRAVARLVLPRPRMHQRMGLAHP